MLLVNYAVITSNLTNSSLFHTHYTSDMGVIKLVFVFRISDLLEIGLFPMLHYGFFA
ncbi:hypothetical protein RhiirA4_551475 [Rhizophagus irregularis]|uniref:Uncharacterized protein n=1 Tax=Rhizophagus irregularis TaxID=588596 RepID=A0A2I1HX24_9GLOM|nr:hypothetical protein RhiirA4_551475 [Rhizophagus irregularis]